MLYDKVVIIEKSSTALYVTCSANGRLAEAEHVSIFPFLKKTLTEYEWDARRKINLTKYYYFKYDKPTGRLHLPVHILTLLGQYLNSNMVAWTTEPVLPNQSMNITISSIGTFEDRDYQTEAIEFLTGGTGMKALELQTGDGKTYIAVRAVTELKLRTLIVVPAHLMEQWHGALTSMCDAKVEVIRGHKSIADLVSSNYDTDVSVFLGSINTLQNYASGDGLYNALPPFREFIKRMMFGVKIVDECHLNFNANVMIDIQSDILHNIYLSATHMRSSRGSNAIFHRIFPPDIKFDSGRTNHHVNITECRYDFGKIEDKYVSTPRGYSEFKYEKLLLRSAKKLDAFINRVLRIVIDTYYINKKAPGQKLLIIVGLRDFAEIIVEWLWEAYPELKSTAFLHGIDDEEIVNSDIIVSTLGSAGTGRDIKKLRTMIMFTSFGSETLTLQSVGRLRKMEDTPEFVYLVNMGVTPHRRHADTKRPVYKHIAKQFNIVGCT